MTVINVDNSNIHQFPVIYNFFLIHGCVRATFSFHSRFNHYIHGCKHLTQSIVVMGYTENLEWNGMEYKIFHGV